MEEESAFPPSSPGVAQVQVMDCLEELLKFNLSSSVEETLDIDLGLSKDYCSGLLKDDLDDLDESEGIPNYPLYKHLASALNNCITCGSVSRASNVMPLIHEDESLKQKEKEWSKIIIDKGLELVKMLEAVGFELHVQEPYFTQLRVGLKSVEGRCAVGDYNRIGVGALILFNKCLLVEVEDVKRYASFADMLKAESLDKVLPGVKTIEEGVQIYRKFYTEEKESSHGVLAISVSKVDSQPYIHLAAILTGLSYEGIGSLLGLAHTTGTVSEALPPPKAAVLSSFLKSHKPNCL